MKIAVIGTGGVGGYYGGLLAHNGEDVTFLARGTHAAAIRAHGLQIQSIHGDITVSPAKVTDDPGKIGHVDLVLFCVKAYDTDQLAQAILPLVGSETTVLSLQNGVDAAERLGSVVGPARILGGATWVSASVTSPGVIRQVSTFRRIVIGELDGRITPRLLAIHAAVEKTGVTIETTDNIRKILWTKFVFISAVSGMGSLTRLAIGEYSSVPETRQLITQLMREVKAVAQSEGVALDGDVVEKTLAFIDNVAPQMKASMQLDIAAGRRSEIESMIGVIGQKGRAAGIPTPAADMIYAALLPVDLKARSG